MLVAQLETMAMGGDDEEEEEEEQEEEEEEGGGGQGGEGGAAGGGGGGGGEQISPVRKKCKNLKLGLTIQVINVGLHTV
jgi:hypothetical protein